MNPSPTPSRHLAPVTFLRRWWSALAAATATSRRATQARGRALTVRSDDGQPICYH